MIDHVKAEFDAQTVRKMIENFCDKYKVNEFIVAPRIMQIFELLVAGTEEENVVVATSVGEILVRHSRPYQGKAID